MPRVKMFNEEEALMKALDLFWEKGYEATSLTDLTTKLEIGKGSFYATFESKKNLFDRALRTYSTGGYETVDALFAEKEKPLEGIRHFLDHHTKFLLSDSGGRGCLVANTTTELAGDEQMEAFLVEHNGIMKFKLVDYLKKGNFSTDLEALADMILTQVTGISVLSKIVKDEARLEASNDLFMALIEKM